MNDKTMACDWGGMRTPSHHEWTDGRPPMRMESWYPAFMFCMAFKPNRMPPPAFDTIIVDLRDREAAEYEWVHQLKDCTLVAVDNDRERLLDLLRRHGQMRCLTEWRTVFGDHAAWMGASGPTPCTPMLYDGRDGPIRLGPGGHVTCGLDDEGAIPLELWRWMLRNFSPYSRGEYCSARHNGAILVPDITDAIVFEAAWMEQRRLCAWPADCAAQEVCNRGLDEWGTRLVLKKPPVDSVRRPLDVR